MNSSIVKKKNEQGWKREIGVFCQIVYSTREKVLG